MKQQSLAILLGHKRVSFLPEEETLCHKNGLQNSDLSHHIYHQLLICLDGSRLQSWLF